MTGSARLKLWDLSFVLLLGGAILLRAMIPAGWMPAGEAEGFWLKPCGSWQKSAAATPPARHGEHEAAHAGSHHDSGEGEGGGSHPDQPCAFAGLAMPCIGGGAQPTLLGPSPAAFAAAAFPSASAPGRGLAAPPPPSTGPPVLA